MPLYYEVDMPYCSESPLSTLAEFDTINNDGFNTLNEQAELTMSELKSSIHEKYPNLNLVHKVETSLLIDSLKNYCEELRSVLVIIGITVIGTRVNKIIGSNSLSVIHHLNNPLLVASRNAIFKPTKNVCFACDLKNVATAMPLFRSRHL
jgi:hypothetical protein